MGYSFLILLGIGLSVAAGADLDCEKFGAQGLTKEQAGALCHAQSIDETMDESLLENEIFRRPGQIPSPETKEFLRKSFQETSKNKPFKIRVLDAGTPSCRRPLVLLGEKHFKKTEAFAAGKNLVEKFRFRGYEGFQRAHTNRLKGSAGLTKSFDDASRVMDVLTENGILHGSTIYDAQMHGPSIGYNNAFDLKSRRVFFTDKGKISTSFVGLAYFLGASGGGDPNFHLRELSRCMNISGEIPEHFSEALKDPAKFAAAFRNVLDADKQAHFNFHLENGELESYDYDCSDAESDSCRGYVQGERNKLMVKNIRAILPNLPCGEPFLVIVGINHLVPIEKMLQKGSGLGSR